MTQELSAAQRRGRIESAHYLLKQARALLAPDIAPQALKRVRAAIKSSEGALRHAECMETRDAELDASIDAEEARQRAAEEAQTALMLKGLDVYNAAPCALCQNKEHGAEDCPHTDYGGLDDCWD